MARASAHKEIPPNHTEKTKRQIEKRLIKECDGVFLYVLCRGRDERTVVRCVRELEEEGKVVCVCLMKGRRARRYVVLKDYVRRKGYLEKTKYKIGGR